MRPGPAAVVKLILDTTAIDAPPVPIVELATELIVSQGWETSRHVARERGERWAEQILTRIQTEINALGEVGRPPRITFNSSSGYMLQGACFVEPSDSNELIELKRRRARAAEYLTLLGSISALQFEKLCGRLLQLLGIHNVVVTRRSADEGIDFYGTLEVGRLLPAGLTATVQRHLSVTVIGQAKRYLDTQVGTAEIRDLVGAITLLRSGAIGSVKTPFNDLRVRAAEPLFAVLATAGSLSLNAWRLLLESGVIGFDGEMIAAFLADQEASIRDSHFDRDVFYEWLDKPVSA
jgi:hypothetical protein